MHLLRIAGFAAGAALALAAAAPAAGVRVLAEGGHSRIEKPLRKVVRTQAEWAELWKSHRGGTAGLPKVDWSREMVVAVFGGSRPTGGYRVKIRAVRAEKGKMQVVVDEQPPPRGAITIQVISHPYQIVAVPKSSLPVAWQ